MNIRSNTSIPAATSATTSLTNGLCHTLPKRHHLDKRVDGILAAQPPGRGNVSDNSDGTGPEGLITTKELAAWLGVGALFAAAVIRPLSQL